MNATADQPIEDHLAILRQARGVRSTIMVRLPRLAPDAVLRRREEQNAAEPSAVGACAR
ncbi:MAG: hypothetical protein ISQ11_00810 [Planctomycetes bacterium]|nr:hypothetical protein [Planctomycetota bacterium]